MKNLQNSFFYIFSLLFILSANFASGQKKITMQKRKQMMDAAQELFGRYIKGINTDWSDTSEVNAFRSCFAKDAEIYDDIAPDTASRDMERNFRFKQGSIRNLPTRNVDELFRIHSALFNRDTSQSHRLSAEVKNANFNFAPLVNGSISVVFAKETNGQTNFGLQKFSNLDTLQLVMDFDNNFSNPKISKIIRWTSNDNSVFRFVMKPRIKFLECPGDPDCDGVYGAADLCPSLTGFDPDGCPSQAVVPGLTFSGGILLIGQTNPSNISKDRLGIETINYKVPTIKSGNNFGIKIGAEYDSWLGKYKNYGFGFGAFYSFSSASMSIDNYNVSYLRTEGNGNQYQQDISVGKATEQVTFHNISLPFLLKFSGRKLSIKRFNYFVHAGAFVLLGIQGLSNGTYENTNYESQYGANPGNTFSNGSDPTRTWGISETRLNEITGNTNKGQLTEAEKIYQDRKQKAGYNVGFNESQSKQKDNFFRAGGIGFIFRAGFSQRLNRKTNILICAEAMYLNNPAKPSVNYKMTESATSANYNTFMAASNSMAQWTFGFTAAYQFKLYKKKVKK